MGRRTGPQGLGAKTLGGMKLVFSGVTIVTDLDRGQDPPGGGVLSAATPGPPGRGDGDCRGPPGALEIPTGALGSPRGPWGPPEVPRRGREGKGPRAL